MTLAPFVLPARARQAMVDHAERDKPLECCGLLVGHGRTVVDVVPMTNTLASPVRFRLDDREHIELRRAVRRLNPPRTILGVYHSHPQAAARPSATDMAEAYYREWLYVIIGLAGHRPRVRGFAWDAGRMRPVRLVVTSGA